MFWKITHFTKKQCLQNQQNQKLWSEIIEKFLFTINKIFRKKIENVLYDCWEQREFFEKKFSPHLNNMKSLFLSFGHNKVFFHFFLKILVTVGTLYFVISEHENRTK